jgi:hypothetical protein
MRFRSGMKPMSSMRSASSSTRNCTWDSSALRLPQWSSKRPGVATRISTPALQGGSCTFMSTPPNTTVLRSGRFLL